MEQVTVLVIPAGKFTVTLFKIGSLGINIMLDKAKFNYKVKTRRPRSNERRSNNSVSRRY